MTDAPGTDAAAADEPAVDIEILSGIARAGERFGRRRIVDMLLRNGDHYLHLADLASYGAAHQQLGALYAQPDAWFRKVILNIAASGRFSSDRTIAEYAREIWQIEPCPID